MPTFLEGEPILQVDFNNVADRGRLIKASLRRFPGWQPQPGQRVYLHDADGNSCFGSVDHVAGVMVFLAADDATWRSVEPVVTTWEMSHVFGLAA